MAEREGKKVSDLWQPVLLLDDDDGKTAETGKAFGDLTVKYHYQGATSKTTYNITADDWKESGEGEYWLRIGASEFSSEGKYQVSVACAGCRTHRFIVNVKDNTFAEVDDVINTIDGNVDTINSNVTTIDGKIDVVDGNVDTINSNVTTIDGNVDIVDDKVDDIDDKVDDIDNNTSGGNIEDISDELF